MSAKAEEQHRRGVGEPDRGARGEMIPEPSHVVAAQSADELDGVTGADRREPFVVVVVGVQDDANSGFQGSRP